ncbi:hypothetical protein HN51_050627 [Arachis hypogaea]|uniref:aldehyde oxidase GLOX-like n=1 Tax=Arachis ipaensis TaxID=130454 RepID=UPI0007AF43A5|nr:aldehyde oxidase GLOX-like [Arachis ipaensis]XP_025664654.1 aldehyde oxidase GLOX-like [Arachis hypogaea]
MSTLQLKLLLLSFVFFHILHLATVNGVAIPTQGKGQWQLLQPNIGIVAMHMQLLHNERVVILDRTDFGFSNISLPNGTCRHDPTERAVKTDCTAHSVEYDIATNTIRPLFVQTDVWCSSGSVDSFGRLVQTGGDSDGERVVRTFHPCPTCNWNELPNRLLVRRWYATNHVLPGGRQIIIGGRAQFNYEFFPKKTSADFSTHFLPFLKDTADKLRQEENNLYPFVFLNVDGNLFIFANNRAILFNYRNNTVIRTYPTISGGDPRCYPSTGSAVLLPLKNLEAESLEAEVLICGGATRAAFFRAGQGTFLTALNTCARMKITDQDPEWVMETMPGGRVMNDMITLPNGDVLIINGASEGSAGFEYAVNPVFAPFLYKPNEPVGNRFEELNPSQIARMYHSTAILVRDGRILVGGSNPHGNYVFKGVMFPTELRFESFSPPYLDAQFSHLRPSIVCPNNQSYSNLTYNQSFKMRISFTDGTVAPDLVSVTMYAPPFNTHSFSMNQRLLELNNGELRHSGNLTFEFDVRIPRSPFLAPPGFYILYAVHQGIPSEGIWIRLIREENEISTQLLN